MKKLLLTMTALAAFGAAAPASAQYAYDYRDRSDVTTSVDFRSRIAQLQARLDIGIRQGVISRSEERLIRSRLSYLRDLERSYSFNGLTAQERRDLRERLREARNEIRFADNGRFDRDMRYGIGSTMATSVRAAPRRG